MPRIQTIIPQLDSLIVSLNAIAENKTIESSLANINELTGNLKKASVGINRIGDKDVPELCTNMNTVLTDFSKVSGNLSKVDFDKTVAQLNSTLSGWLLLTQNNLLLEWSALGWILWSWAS